MSATILERETEGIPATTAAEAAALGAELRAAGLDRILFGSDAPVFAPERVATLLVERAGLTAAEVRAMLTRTAPGLFTP